MPFGVGFILVLLIVGGIAAYWGDHIGMIVGRKRLTIMGLRPKHTSRVIAIGTGILIVLFTLGTLLIASHSVRQALFGMEELNARVTLLSTEVNAFEEKRIELEGRNESLLGRNDELIRLNDALIAKSLQLEAETDQLEREKEELDSEVTSLKSQVVTVRTELRQARIQLETLEESLEFVRFLGEQFWNVAQTLYEAEFAIHVGDVLHTFLVDLSAGSDQAIMDLEKGLATAEMALARQGFSQSDGNGTLRLDRTYSLGGDIVAFSAGDVLDEALDTLMEWSEQGLTSVIVQLSAVTNARVDDPVFADFRFMIDEVVFEKGESLGVEVFDPAVDQGKLIEQVMAFIQREISAIARTNLLPLDGDYGQVTLAEVYSAVEQISQFNGPVRMEVKAVKDIWAHESLSVQFDFREMDAPEESGVSNG